MSITNELVRTSHGIIHLNNAIAGGPDGLSGAKILALAGGDLTYLPLEPDAASAPAGPVLRVTTHRSNSVQLAAGAGLLTVGDDLEWTTAPVEERPPGRELITARLVQPMATDGPLLEKCALPGERPRTRNKFAAEVALDYDFGRLCALYISEGWTDNGERRNHVHIATTVGPLIREMKRIVGRYAEGEPVFSKMESAHTFDGRDAYSEKWSFSSCRLAAFFREELGRTSGEKRLPSWWGRTPSAFRWGLLSGLIDGDGGVSVSRPKAKRGNRRSAQVQVKFDTSSEALARGVLALGRSLGLEATLGTYAAPSGKTMHLVTFSQDAITTLRRALDLKHPEKAEKLVEHTPPPGRRRGVYAPPLSRERLKELRRAVWGARLAREEGWSDAYAKRRRRLYGNVGDALRDADPKNGRRGLPLLLRDTAEVLIAELPEFFAEGFWARWRRLVLDERFAWEIVEEVEPVEDAALEDETPEDVASGAALQGIKARPAGIGEPIALFTAGGFGVALR